MIERRYRIVSCVDSGSSTWFPSVPRQCLPPRLIAEPSGLIDVDARWIKQASITSLVTRPSSAQGAFPLAGWPTSTRIDFDLVEESTARYRCLVYDYLDRENVLVCWSPNIWIFWGKIVENFMETVKEFLYIGSRSIGVSFYSLLFD